MQGLRMLVCQHQIATTTPEGKWRGVKFWRSGERLVISARWARKVSSDFIESYESDMVKGPGP